MAEMDLLSPHGYAEEVYGSLLIRTAAVEPPRHPLGQEYAEPHFGVWAREARHERGWVCVFNTPDPDGAVCRLSDEDLDRIAQLSVLVGADWEAVAEDALNVRRVQEGALQLLPPHVYDQSVEELLGLRVAINQRDPFAVATLISMTYHWQTDPGGTLGPRFAG